jgi:hypothetical protein
MAVPAWNDEWERPDPLQGRRGWARHHYANGLVVAVLVILALGMLLPVIAKSRRGHPN